MSFIPQEYLADAVKSKDIINIKVALGGYIRMQPGNRKEIQAAIDYVKKELPDIELIEAHDGIPFKSREDWNKEYVWELISDLMENFSEERLQHIFNVGEYVNPVQVNKSNTINAEKAKVNKTMNNRVRAGFRTNNTGKKPQRIAAKAALTAVGVAVLWYLVTRN